jgi:hypothetical protein
MLAVAASWVAAVALWAAYGDFIAGQNWQWPRDVAISIVFLGLPVPFAALVVHWPVLSWLNRRATGAFLIAFASVVLALPLVLWPVMALGGRIQQLNTPGAWNYAGLYATFGLLVGIWFATRRSASPEIEMRRRKT